MCNDGGSIDGKNGSVDLGYVVHFVEIEETESSCKGTEVAR